MRLSDRRLLNAIATHCGFAEEQKSSVFIALDKLDKVGIDGVLAEAIEIAPDKAQGFVDLLTRVTQADDPFAAVVTELGDDLPADVADNIRNILYVANSNVTNGKVKFDVTLVRGMGYYTGTIYEISVDGLNSSVGGGGRYDKMIGKMIGTDVPACGFSIGFERIVLLLSERGYKVDTGKGIAVLVDKRIDAEELAAVSKLAGELRTQGNNVTLLKKIKNFGFQLKQLRDQGFTVKEYVDGNLHDVD